jgi:hypothetical protein
VSKAEDSFVDVRVMLHRHIDETLVGAGIETPEKLAARSDLTSLHNALKSCLNSANIYAAMTGDDSLSPEVIQKERKQMLKDLPNIIEAAQRNKEEGREDLF